MAIAFDTSSLSSKTTGTSATVSHTCASGSSLFVAIMSNTNNALPSGVTYNGVAMSLVASKTDSFSIGFGIYFLASPATGANNIVATYAASQTFQFAGLSYTGVNTAQPDSSNGGAAGFDVSPLIATTTVATANSWLLAMAYGTGTSLDLTARSGTTNRQTGGGFSSPDSLAFADSNGAVATGSQTLSWNNGGNSGSEWLIISIKIGAQTFPKSLAATAPTAVVLSKSKIKVLSLAVTAATSIGLATLKTFYRRLAALANTGSQLLVTPIFRWTKQSKSITEVVVASYDGPPTGAYLPLNDNFYPYYGQSFAVPFAAALTSCQFYFLKTGAPASSIYAYLYALSGTYGTTSIPTGSPLATSDPLSPTAISSGFTPTLLTFTFSGGNQYQLQSNTDYVLVLSNNGTPTDYISVEQVYISPSYSGNYSYSADGVNWHYSNNLDLYFYVNGSPDWVIASKHSASFLTQAKSSSSFTNQSKTNSRWF